jgi:hypothetical protein
MLHATSNAININMNDNAVRNQLLVKVLAVPTRLGAFTSENMLQTSVEQ